MYTRFLSLLAAALLLACNTGTDGKLSPELVRNGQSADGSPAELPVITFDGPDYNFGKVNEGDKVAHTFRFTNTGKSDLIISNAQPSCGCTVADFPHHPIKPGESGQIETVFDTNGKAGSPHKTITVSTNCEPAIVEISISGEVTPKAH